MNKSVLRIMAVVMILSVLLAACQPETVIVTQIVEGETIVVTATPPPEAPELEIFHWWTGPGEREAADAMFAALADAYPEVTVVENPVAGGGGVSHRVVLQGRMAAGLPPDTFQTLGGAEMKTYVDNGQLTPLDDLWQELGYYDVVPGPLANAVSVDGIPYVVPLNMHIQNILYYDKALFDELGLSEPKNFEQLMSNCEAIKAAYPEKAPLGMGSKEAWAAAFVFDSILLEEGGAEYYVQFHKGLIDVTNDAIYKGALEKLMELNEYTYEFAPNLTWDESVGLVVNGDAGMVIMGTWAIGAFISNGWEPDVDFGALTFPQEPERILLFHPDTYGLATGAPHPESTMKWLKVVASPELQIPTDVTQGGMFARTDIASTEFPDPIRQEMNDFVAANPGNLILDQHGSIAPSAFSSDYWKVIAGLMAGERDIDSTIKAVADLFVLYNVVEEAAWYQWP